MTKEEFGYLQESADKYLTITKENIFDKSVSLSTFYSKCLSLYSHELIIYKNMNTEKENRYSKLYIKHKNSNADRRNKSDVEPYIFSDEEYYHFLKQLNDQEVMVNHIESLLDFIKKMTYHITNLVTMMKMERGIQ